MRFFGFNITKHTPAPKQKSLNPAVLEWLGGEDLNTTSSRLQNMYPQVTWVYRAIQVLAEQVANIPFRFSVGAAGGEHLITHGPLVDFYNHPHPHINRFQYWELRVIWLMLRGECMRIPIYQDQPEEFRGSHSARRTLKRVLVLDPARFQHIIKNNELIGWRYTGLGPRAPLASQVFLPEEVWFERLPNPYDFWRGLPPLYAATEAARTDFAAGIFMQGIIENNCDTGLIVRSEKPLSDEQREQLDAEIRKRRCRAGVANGPLVLSGVTQMIKPELSSSDLQFLENRKFSRAEICAAFGVPEEIITTTDGAKYDVMAGARLNFIENRVAPLCRRLEADEEVTVKTLDPNAAGWFDLDSLPIMQQARQSRLAAAQTGFSMGVPFNELNRVLDLGFKPLPWGERGWLAGGLKEAGTESTRLQAPTSSETPNPRHEVNGEGDPFGRALKFLCSSRRKEAVNAEASSFKPRTSGKTQNSNCKKAERVLVEGRLRRFFFEQRRRVLSRFFCAQPNNISPISPISCMSPTPLLDLAAENTKLIARLQPIVLPERAATEINQPTLAALTEAFAASAAAGETNEQFSRRVRQIYNEAGSVRAREIATRLVAQESH